eukprot:3244140-Prymnesium_polylepis.2
MMCCWALSTVVPAGFESHDTLPQSRGMPHASWHGMSPPGGKGIGYPECRFEQINYSAATLTVAHHQIFLGHGIHRSVDTLHCGCDQLGTIHGPERARIELMKSIDINPNNRPDAL